MSGGVDSSVAAAVLLRDYDVAGATMKLFSNEDIQLDRGKTCCSLDDVQDARYAANRLGIEHYVFGFGGRFDRFYPFCGDARNVKLQQVAQTVEEILAFHEAEVVVDERVLVHIKVNEIACAGFCVRRFCRAKKGSTQYAANSARDPERIFRL